MLRWLGAVLILSGGLLTRRSLVEEKRTAQRVRRELASSYESMAEEIKLLLTPLPTLLRRCSGGTDVFFEQAQRALSSGGTAAEAWAYAAESLPLPEEERSALASLGGRLNGDADGVCAALSLAAVLLRRSYAERETVRHGEERLITSICVCISLYLAILLI